MDIEERSLEDIAADIGRKMDETPEPAAEAAPSAPAADEIQPEAEAETPPDAVAEPSEEAQAPADEVPTVTPEAPKVSAPGSTELDARIQAATKAEQEATQARDQYLAQTSLFVQHQQAAFTAAFPDIQSREDLINMANPQSPTYSVDRYNAANFALMQLQESQLKQQAAQAEADKARNDQMQKFQAEELKKLPDLIPEFKDPAKAPSHAKALQEYAFKIGYTPEQLKFASARDFALLNKAMRDDMRAEGEAASAAKAAAALAEANKKAAKAPPVQQPGTPRNATSAKDERAREQSARFAKTGSLQDLAELLSLKGI